MRFLVQDSYKLIRLKNKKNIWLEAAYAEFARCGPESFNIDRLSHAVKKSRSSFYHRFGDMEGFRDDFYEYHWAQSRNFAQALDDASSFYPDFAKLLEQYKDWTFAHIQMYHQRERCEKCEIIFNKVTELIEEKIAYLWSKSAGLGDLPTQKTKYLYRVIRDTMFSKMIYDNFTPEFLDEQIRGMNKSLEFLVTGVQQN